ncbi:thioesterase family protein [Bradyrhizobium sp. CCBAU 51745]|uniref:thioesterase family protein n=1 Tax=Bradyrhizobium sp. CCBAU 51745 TaxID=1325099 RepID=UPI003FA406FC
MKIRTSLIASDTKRFHLLHRLESAGDLVSMVETLNLCFDPVARRVAPFAADISSYFSSWSRPSDDGLPPLSIGRRPFRN